MSDLELREAERAWRSAVSWRDLDVDTRFERVQALRARACLPLWCASCGVTTATKVREEIMGGEPYCLACLESALEHGHQHVDHDPPIAECPACRRVVCPRCNERPALVVVPYGDDVEKVCEECRHHALHGDAARGTHPDCALCLAYFGETLCCATGCSEPAMLPLGVCRDHAWESREDEASGSAPRDLFGSEGS